MLSFLKTRSFVAYDDPKTYTQEEVDALTKNKFTQEQVNTFVATEKRKTQESQTKLMDQLEEYKTVAKLTTDEKATLENQIEELRTKTMTVEERARQTKEKEDVKHKDEKANLEADRDSWKTQYTESTIANAITQAAVANKAIVPQQVIAMLRPTTRLAEVMEDNKIVGHEPRTMFNDVDKENKPVVLDLTVAEAVKRMTEVEQFGNLFAGNIAGGLGGKGGRKKAADTDIVKIAREDPAQYRKLRKERPELFSNM